MPDSAPSSSSSLAFSLVARDLAREHGSVTVLDGVDLTVGPRTRLGVIGPNGVGKTTLLRLLAGVERPDRGQVSRTPAALRVGYLPQEPERSDDETEDRSRGQCEAQAHAALDGHPHHRRSSDQRSRRPHSHRLSSPP